jgi:preprotein translocase subunit SecA
MIYDLSEDIVTGHKATGNFEDFTLNIIRVFGFDTAITAAELASTQEAELTEKLYNEALTFYLNKNKVIAEHSLPIITDIYQNRSMIETIAVPFSDGRKQITAMTNLEKAYQTQSRELIKEMEKAITLTTIDQAWTQHLREMDDLKQSVQNAVYEQKDPLLIYKFESFELFKRMIGKVNEETVSFLFKADIPVQRPEEVQEARPPKPAKAPALKVQKEEVHSVLEGPAAEEAAEAQAAVKAVPVRSHKVAGRNDKVSVQYNDGRVVRDVKYKSVEQDVLNHRCVIIED